eukprot:6491785-Amphidinium_carterae.1
MASRQRVLASLRSRSRGAPRPFVVGERVWVWRSPGSGRAEAWYGPGTVVCLTPTGAYVSLKGSLWKVNARCLRRQEGEDRLSDEMIGRFLSRLRTDMAQEGLRTQRRYVDCTRETPPLLIDDDTGQNIEQAVLPLPNVATASAEVQEEQRAEVQEEQRSEVQEEQRAELQEEQRAEVQEEQRAEVQDSQQEEQRAELQEEQRAEVQEEQRGEKPMQTDANAGTSLEPSRVRFRQDNEDEEAPPRVRARQQEREEMAPLFRGSIGLRSDPPSADPPRMWNYLAGEPLMQEPAQKEIVLPENLPPEVQTLFRSSRAKEEEGIREHLRPLSESEAQIVEQTEEVIPSRWLDVWKVKDNDEPNGYPKEYNIPSDLHAKSRWIIEGHRDPSILELERSVLGSAGGELLWVLQVAVDHGFVLEAADVKGAFTQTDMTLPENARTKKVYIKLLWQGLTCFPGVRIVELLCWIYGLSSAPLAWRNTMLAFLREVGFRIHPMSPSAFVFLEAMKVDETGVVHAVSETTEYPIHMMA